MNTVSPDMCATRVKNLFERIHREQMAGLPLLNKALQVATLGFREFEGRTLGMLITPWMMSLLRFPDPQDDWQFQALGTKHMIAFPSGTYRFMVNVVDELGACQVYSLHSPMNRFDNQAAAVAEAQSFMDKLLVTPPEGVAHDPVDEELLGKIMRGEIVPPSPSPENESNPSLTEIT
ncbi:MAG: [NiFe]-hydrogenase assembly chaperone HybE [Burkholderiales bacterium]|nr:[NiFe]-hydrogenase assembly chaperone HybE [Burkholderiales bacterium]